MVAVNLADEPASLDGVRGTVRISTERARDGETVDGTLELDAWQGAVVLASALRPRRSATRSRRGGRRPARC